MSSTVIITVVLFCLGIIVGIIGYFLRIVHQDHRDSVMEIGKLKGKIELVEQESKNKYNHLSDLTNLHLQNMSDKIGTLSDQIGEVLKRDKK